MIPCLWTIEGALHADARNRFPISQVHICSVFAALLPSDAGTMVTCNKCRVNKSAHRLKKRKSEESRLSAVGFTADCLAEHVVQLEQIIKQVSNE